VEAQDIPLSVPDVDLEDRIVENAQRRELGSRQITGTQSGVRQVLQAVDAFGMAEMGQGS
jgi:hypothetical protein